MRRGGYPMDLKKQLKFRVNEEIYKEISRRSEDQGKTLSCFLRDIIIKSLSTTVSSEM